MIKNKLKFLIFIGALFIANIPLSVFAESKITSTNTPQGNNTILDGEIGEWDPNITDAPNFNNINTSDIQGKIPTKDEYFTISVTVPIDMEFYVLPNSNLAFGSFYSPEYTIKNNGSKKLEAKINSFTMTNDNETNTNTPLYIEQVVGGDGKTQMELNICAIENLDANGNPKEVDLTQITTLNDEDKKLYELNANAEKKVKFTSKKWELPQFESKKDTASSSYTASFEFSIKN